MAHPLQALTPLPLYSPSLILFIAMDVNTTWKLCPTPPKGCYRYRDTNYLVKDYLHWMDIRLLIAEQWKELIKDLLALKDIVSKEEDPLAEEDFA